MPQRVASERVEFEVVERVAGLEHPWALAFLPDGAMLVTERAGRLRRINIDGTVSAPIVGLPKMFVDGQAGLLDVALSPTFADDHRVYLSFAEPNLRGNKAGTAVARGRLEGDALLDIEVIYRQEPKLSSGTHVGSRLVFDDAGHLFVTQGENNKRPTAQELDKLQGKLVRINADGALDLFGNQSSGVLTSAVWGDGLVDNPGGQVIRRGDVVRFLPFADLMGR